MSTQTPFFMRFVEKQDDARVETQVVAGADDDKKKKKKSKPWEKGEETFKYPSDYDEEYMIGWP